VGTHPGTGPPRGKWSSRYYIAISTEPSRMLDYSISLSNP